MKARFNLTNMKSRCFILVVCLTLILGTTACSNEDFGTDLPEQEKVYSKQELIEMALSRIPMTRANGITPIQMVTINKTVSIKCKASEEVYIYWGNDIDTVPPNSNAVYTHTYTDNELSYSIFIGDSGESIQSLNVDNNRLISLNLNTPNLNELYCQNNLLDELNLTNCPALRKLNAENNELTSIEIFTLTKLNTFQVSNNYLTEVDFSNNKYLTTLFLENNRIKNIDLTNNPQLITLFIGNNSITDLNLKYNPNLLVIAVGNLPLRTFNEIPIDLVEPDIFSIYKELIYIDVAYTPFAALDLSKNSSVFGIDISGTTITELDLSNLKMEILYATRSKLGSLNYTGNTLKNLYDLRIERTPFENNPNEIANLFSALIIYTKNNKPKTLYTYTPINISNYIDGLTDNNWVINPL